ncbi:MAG: hypothetical protein F6K31_04550 [Symploca sp. SIO2G7]|nr:hypothetical protein [Symploca sp. SIO2G7]
MIELSSRESLANTHSLAMVKGFFIWTFTLEVCLLVVGFPLIVLIASIGVMLAITLQAFLSVSAVLLVAGLLVGSNILVVVLGAGILTFKGIRPQDVSWLSWLHGESKVRHTPVFAACPLTCDIRGLEFS